MIDEEILDRLIPVPTEEEEMENLQRELKEAGFAVTNFATGGVFYHLARLVVREEIELLELARTMLNGCFIRHAEGDWLDIKAADFSKARKEAVKTQGYVTVRRSEYGNALQVTKGHPFKTVPDAMGKEYKFYALDTQVIAAGAASGRVLVEAEEPGTGYNLPPGRITISMIHLEGVESVSNEDGWIYQEGADEEGTESFRERCIRSYEEQAEQTIAGKLKNAAEAVEGVLDARIDDQHPRGQGTVDIIITGTAGHASDALLAQVAEAVSPLKGNYDDYLVKGADVVMQDVEIIIYIAKGASAMGIADTAEYILRNSVMKQNRELNELYRDTITAELKSGIPTYKKSDIIQPADDLILGEDKTIVLGQVSISVRNIA